MLNRLCTTVLLLTIFAPLADASALSRPPRGARTRIWYSATPGSLWVIITSGGDSRSYALTPSTLSAHVLDETLIFRLDARRLTTRLVTSTGSEVRRLDEPRRERTSLLGGASLSTLAADYDLLERECPRTQELAPLARALDLLLARDSQSAPAGVWDLSPLDAALSHRPHITRLILRRAKPRREIDAIRTTLRSGNRAGHDRVP